MSVQIKNNIPQKFRQYQKALKARLKGVLGLMIQSFASTAMEYSPPGITSKKAGHIGKRIKKELYYRQFQYLPSAVRKSKNPIASIDAEYLRKGFYYRLISLKKLKNTRGVEYRKNGLKLYGYYFKNLATMRRYQKIKNRGLLKAMYGANMPSIGLNVPNVIKSIMNKSKNLFSLISINVIKYFNNNQSIELKNNYADGMKRNSFQKIAIRQGNKKALKTMKKQIKIIKQEIKNEYN